MKIQGIDDAGRGCIIGPLVIAAVVFDDKSVQNLSELGVKDSKKLSRKKREKLSDQIIEMASDHSFFELQPKSIDLVVERKVKLRKLNYLEAMAMASLINLMKPDKAYIDASDTNAIRFKEEILAVTKTTTDIICEHKADVNYPVVSAASILAKVHRDNIVSRLREEYGDFNSGYPSDKKTMAWLQDWFKVHDECPPFMRSSWKPVKRLRERLHQTYLAKTRA